MVYPHADCYVRVQGRSGHQHHRRFGHKMAATSFAQTRTLDDQINALIRPGDGLGIFLLMVGYTAAVYDQVPGRLLHGQLSFTVQAVMLQKMPAEFDTPEGIDRNKFQTGLGLRSNLPDKLPPDPAQTVYAYSGDHRRAMRSLQIGGLPGDN